MAKGSRAGHLASGWNAALSGAAPSRGQAGYAKANAKKAVRGYMRSPSAPKSGVRDVRTVGGAYGRNATKVAPAPRSAPSGLKRGTPASRHARDEVIAVKSRLRTAPKVVPLGTPSRGTPNPYKMVGPADAAKITASMTDREKAARNANVAKNKKYQQPYKVGTSRIQPVGKTYAAKKGVKVSKAYGRRGH